MLEQAKHHGSDHLVVDLQMRRVSCKKQELLGVLFKSLALLQKHDKAHKGFVLNVAIIVDDNVSHVLSQCYWVLMVDSNLDYKVDQLWRDLASILNSSHILNDFLEVLLFGSDDIGVEE